MKIESDDSNTGGLDMYVDTPDDGVIKLIQSVEEDVESGAVTDQSADWSRERSGDLGGDGDQSGMWFAGQSQQGRG